jgi:hypothetical protein
MASTPPTYSACARATAPAAPAAKRAAVVAALRRVTAKRAEAHQRDLELDCDHRVDAASKRERDGRAQIVELGFQPARPFRLLGSLQLLPRLLGNAEVIVAVPGRRRDQIAPIDKSLARELLDRPQHPVA